MAIFGKSEFGEIIFADQTDDVPVQTPGTLWIEECLIKEDWEDEVRDIPNTIKCRGET